MKQPFKPQGYSSVSAYLMADGAQRVVEFVTEVFGAKQLRHFDMPDGSIMHVEMQIDDSVIMLADGGRKHQPFPSGCMFMYLMWTRPISVPSRQAASLLRSQVRRTASTAVLG